MATHLLLFPGSKRVKSMYKKVSHTLGKFHGNVAGVPVMRVKNVIFQILFLDKLLHIVYVSVKMRE